MKNKILVLDSFHPSLIEMLDEKNIHYDYFKKIRVQELEKIIQYYSIVVLRSGVVLDKNILSKAKKLKMIIRGGSGMEHIDLPYCHQQSIACRNIPSANGNAVGEFTVCLILMLLNQIKRSSIGLAAGQWNRQECKGRELKDKTVGIIGYGHTGLKLAEKLKSFHCKILAYDKYKKGFSSDTVVECKLENIYQHADIVSFHIPLNKENKYLIDSSYLAAFKKPIYLINTSRGDILKINDLIQAIKNNKITAAALDVISGENNALLFKKDYFKYCLESEKIILTPHIAGLTMESEKNIAHEIMRIIKE